jgi:hypothetical protein
MVHENEFDEPSSDINDKVEDAIHGLAEGAPGQIRGKLEQAMSNGQETFEAMLDNLRDTAAARPLTALAIVGGAFFVLGFLARVSLSGNDNESA